MKKEETLLEIIKAIHEITKLVIERFENDKKEKGDE